MSEEEFNSVMSGFVPPPKTKSTEYHEVTERARLPNSFDWRRRGAVTGVKSQGKCGSCWAFASNGALEGAYFLKYGQLKSFSEQNILDCVRPYNDGCYDGNSHMAWNFIHANDGVSANNVYPYVAKKGRCQSKPKDSRAKVQRIISIRSGDEEALKHAVATIGPITVSIDASKYPRKLNVRLKF